MLSATEQRRPGQHGPFFTGSPTRAASITVNVIEFQRVRVIDRQHVGIQSDNLRDFEQTRHLNISITVQYMRL